MILPTYKLFKIALLFVGSAILIYSCSSEQQQELSTAKNESLMTEYSEDLSVIMSENGRRSFFFEAPLLEGYTEFREPYREFRKGVKITTYQDDSLTTVDAILTANYAIHYDKRGLWEAKGDVVVEKSDGKKLFTQQLFWDTKTKRIYSNVDSKLVQSGGKDEYVGEGFETDEAFTNWRFRRMKGRMEVETAPTTQPDSIAEGVQTESVVGVQDVGAQDAQQTQEVGKQRGGQLAKRPSPIRKSLSDSEGGAPLQIDGATLDKSKVK